MQATIAEIKEALWVAVMSFIGVLFILFLHLSSNIAARFYATGVAQTTVAFWLVVLALVTCCLSVFYLLYDSQPLEFRVSACIFTGVLPLITVAILTANIVLL